MKKSKFFKTKQAQQIADAWKKWLLLYGIKEKWHLMKSDKMPPEIRPLDFCPDLTLEQVGFTYGYWHSSDGEKFSTRAIQEEWRSFRYLIRIEGACVEIYDTKELAPDYVAKKLLNQQEAHPSVFDNQVQSFWNDTPDDYDDYDSD